MKKKAGLWMLVAALCMLAAGCGQNAAPDATATPPVIQAPQIEAQGALAQRAQAVLRDYNSVLEKAAESRPANLAYTIPGEMLDRFVGDAEAAGAQPENGRYRFIRRETGRHVYQAEGLEVVERLAQETQAPGQAADDTPMGEMAGDLVAAGGGAFEREYAYDLAQDLTGGTVEITQRLNGETTGFESYSFAVRDGCLYFVDAAMDLIADLDGVSSAGTYLVAAGKIQKNSADMIEYHVGALRDVPNAAAVDWETLLASVRPESRVTVP